jgi:hypothetical protein
MSRINNSITLYNEYLALKEVRDLALEQYQNMLQSHANEINEFDEEFFFTMDTIQQRLRREEALNRNIIATDFENNFGFPMDFQPAFLTGTFGTFTRTTRRDDRLTSIERIRYFEAKFNSLKDDDNQIDSFRSTFRMDKETFEWLVCKLEEHPQLQLEAHNATPVFVQVAIALIRLANNHIGYRMAYMDWFVSYGSYTNFTRRVVKAIKGLLTETTISWPTDYDRAKDIADRFEYPLTTSNRCLPNVVGAIDGKNCVIRKPFPSLFGSFFRDRKGHYSVKITAVCDSLCRFTYIRVGDSGNFFFFFFIL